VRPATPVGSATRTQHQPGGNRLTVRHSKHCHPFEGRAVGGDDPGRVEVVLAQSRDAHEHLQPSTLQHYNSRQNLLVVLFSVYRCRVHCRNSE
jgi:hypothetical protein